MAITWSDTAAKKSKATNDKIPKDWLLSKDKVPPECERNILHLPTTSEILSERELLITETSMASSNTFDPANGHPKRLPKPSAGEL